MSEAAVGGAGGKSKVIFALDVPDKIAALNYANILKDEVGLFKIGLQLFVAEGPGVVSAVKGAAPGCGIFLDLKFHDVPATVGLAVKNVAATGADLLTVHFGGPAMLKAAVEAAGDTKVLVVTVLTSQSKEDLEASGVVGKLSEPAEQVLSRASVARDAGCAGIICSALEVGRVKSELGEEFLAVTPGIRLTHKQGDDDQKRVASPYEAIRDGADYIVVGRPIRDANDPAGAARTIAAEVDRALEEKN